MYEDLVKRLNAYSAEHEYHGGITAEAADAIEELSKRINFLMYCIYDAEDALDRGADNDWARAALEKAESGQSDV